MENPSTAGAVASPLASPLSSAERLLEQERFDQAITELEAVSDAPGEVSALLGVAYFRAEDYEQSAALLRRAAEQGQNGSDLQQLLERATANAQADVSRAVPSPVRLEDTLPSAPQPGKRSNVALGPRTASPLGEQIVGALGEMAGTKLGEAIGFLARTLGRESKGSVWTTWYRREFLPALIALARRRERLNREQLFSAYAPRAGAGFFRSTGAAPAWTKQARTADGSYNDLLEPMAGAANTRFGFNTDPEEVQGETGERLMTPNPRTVSRTLMTRIDGFKPVPFLNLTAAAWIQFMNHDWVSYGDPDHAKEPYRIPLEPDDPVRKVLRQTHLVVHPTQQDPTRSEGAKVTTHLNEVTAWWDGSQIYGSDAQTVDALRSHEGGKLAVDPETGLLPVLPDGVEQTGFRRNWWLGLSMLHDLFVKEHNAICDSLAAAYPSFDDQKLFDTARLINAAVMAKIHTVEWTPAILPNAVLHAAMNSNWYGFLTNLFRAKEQRKTVAKINVADPIAGGIVGNKTNNHGVPYSLTREFLAVYRLHSLLPDILEFYRVGGGEGPAKTLGLAQTRQAAAHKISQEFGMDDLFYSFGRQHPGQLVLNNFPETLQNLSIPGAGFYDLGAVDVLRDRERGVPRYNAFRRLMGMRPISSFEDLTANADELSALKSVYDSIEDIDLLVGNLAEARRPEGFGFGETLFEVFILNASRRLEADRFFTESYRSEVYTDRGLEWVDGASLKSVLLRHYPRLQETGLANVDNAFEPWDGTPLEPERHPLRQFDARLIKADAARHE